jgi:hypothetical protein
MAVNMTINFPVDGGAASGNGSETITGCGFSGNPAGVASYAVALFDTTDPADIVTLGTARFVFISGDLKQWAFQVAGVTVGGNRRITVVANAADGTALEAVSNDFSVTA